ncbi:MAG: hypothetical protein ISS57_05495 [Anaerolineales bacterium]|nr:hypothetical protein [Anaerolineales bacterium]
MDYLAIVYPILVACFLFGIILVISFVIAVVWLQYVDRRLRECPKCRRKAAGIIVDTKTVRLKRHIDRKGLKPVRITEEQVTDQYECEFCGHTWTRSLKRIQRERVESVL